MNKSTFISSFSTEILQQAKELNLSSIYLNERYISKENTSLIKEILGNDIKIYVEIEIFAGSTLLEKYPDAKPVEASGKDTNKDDYYGICPTHEGVRKEKLERIQELVKEDINGIFLDFICYPTKWEEPEPYILDTCYCPRCLKLFEEYIGEPIQGVGGEGTKLENTALHIDGSYYHEWLEFKTNTVTSFVSEVSKIIKQSANISLGMFAVPWDDSEYGSAIKRIVGQDLMKLSGYIDIFSPMLYHKMCGKDVSWIKDKVDYFWQIGKPFLPLIQTEPKPMEIFLDEFKQAILYATEKPSQGVCIFFLDDLIKHKELFDYTKEYFNSN